MRERQAGKAIQSRQTGRDTRRQLGYGVAGNHGNAVVARIKPARQLFSFLLLLRFEICQEFASLLRERKGQHTGTASRVPAANETLFFKKSRLRHHEGQVKLRRSCQGADR